MSPLPPLYARWMDEFLAGPIPPETHATCLDCPMCSGDPTRNSSGYSFNPNAKCCTYWPDLPNFLVGDILLDDSPPFANGRAAFEAQYNETLIRIPQGVSPPPSYRQAYQKDIAHFGNNVSLLCPYYQRIDSGLCGIWLHRNSRCSTWFCRYERGSVGVIFWKYMDQLLASIERSLARWCVLQLDIGADALEQLYPPPPSEPSITDWKAIWGHWYGKEADFYRECSRLVNPLTWVEVHSIGGAEIHLFARLLYKAYTDLTSSRLPKSLKPGTWKKIEPVGTEMFRIWTYNRYDPIQLPRIIFEALPHFEGLTTADALDKMARNKIPLDATLALKLADFGLLVPA